MTKNQTPESAVTDSHRAENAVTDNQRTESNQTPESAGTDSHRAENAVTDNQRAATKTVKLLVPDINWLNDEKLGGESLAVTLNRLHGELNQLRDERNKYYDVMALKDSQLEDLKDQIMALESEIEDLNSGTSTALTSTDQTSLGDFGGATLKDTMDAIKDVCDDETVCIKAALKMVDTKSELINKQLNRDHVSAEKAKDREEREKDRRLKEAEKAKDRELERERRQHQKELVMIRKGILKKEDLEDVVFLGSIQTKSAKERLEERKRQAYAASASEEDDNLPSMSEGYPGEGEEEWG